MQSGDMRMKSSSCTNLVVRNGEINIFRDLIEIRYDIGDIERSTDQVENDRYDGENCDSLCKRYQENGHRV